MNVLQRVLAFFIAFACSPIGYAANQVVITNLDPYMEGKGGLFRVDTTAGTLTPVSTGGLFQEPNQVARSPSGDYFIANEINVIRIDGTNFTQSVLAQGHLLGLAVGGLAVNAQGRVFASVCCNSGVKSIVEIDAATGTQSLLSAGGLISNPFRITTFGNDALLVTQPDAPGQILRVSTSDGSQQVVSSGGLLKSPWDIQVFSANSAYVLDVGTNSVIAINVQTGEQSLISTGGFLTRPNGIALDTDGSILVTNRSSPQGLIRIMPASGAQSVVTWSGLVDYPYDVLGIAAPVPEPHVHVMLSIGMILVLLISRRQHTHAYGAGALIPLASIATTVPK